MCIYIYIYIYTYIYIYIYICIYYIIYYIFLAKLRLPALPDALLGVGRGRPAEHHEGVAGVRRGEVLV